MENESVNSKPFTYTMSLIGGKWKMQILFWLWKSEIMRYSELKRSLEGITHKMLSNQLKELENDRLIIRTEYPQVPHMYHYSQDKKQNDQHSYKKQNSHRLRLPHNHL